VICPTQNLVQCPPASGGFGCGIEWPGPEQVTAAAAQAQPLGTQQFTGGAAFQPPSLLPHLCPSVLLICPTRLTHHCPTHAPLLCPISVGTPCITQHPAACHSVLTPCISQTVICPTQNPVQCPPASGGFGCGTEGPGPEQF